MIERTRRPLRRVPCFGNQKARNQKPEGVGIDLPVSGFWLSGFLPQDAPAIAV
jgi:hypothetical protein